MNDIVKSAAAGIAGIELSEVIGIAKILAASGYFDKGPANEAQLATKILAGRELGFGPFAAVQGIHVIQGRPAVGANLIASAIKSSAKYEYRVIELTADACEIEVFERIAGKLESLGKSKFTAADARAAGTQNMQKFARNMLFARAISNAARWYCPDLFGGNAVYVPEELGAIVDGDGNVVDVSAHTKPSLPAPKPEPAEPEPELPELVKSWQKPDDAYIWAVEQGFGSIDEAKAEFGLIVNMFFGGKLKSSNIKQAFAKFHSVVKHDCDAILQRVDSDDLPVIMDFADAKPLEF